MDDRLIERALLFAAGHFTASCHNPGKPVYLHSLRVAGLARDLGYQEEVLVAAILHDLLEDTDCSAAEIAAAFGEPTAAIVEALSFDAAIPDRLERNLLCIDACARSGRVALIVKCLDTADNSAFFHLADADTQEYLRAKYAYLLAVAGESIPGEPALLALRERVQAI